MVDSDTLKSFLQTRMKLVEFDDGKYLIVSKDDWEKAWREIAAADQPEAAVK